MTKHILIGPCALAHGAAAAYQNDPDLVRVFKRRVSDVEVVEVAKFAKLLVIIVIRLRLVSHVARDFKFVKTIVRIKLGRVSI